MSAQKNQTDLNHLRRGGTYLATTLSGTTIGEYLGMEAAYGERSVLLRNERGTASIYRNDILSIELAA
ncbi:MAG: hypothetical protein QNJ75_07645 [Acidimicrobiia bacterium]|nr:hypothetical protein [Acidimicrobiia bacterium]